MAVNEPQTQTVFPPLLTAGTSFKVDRTLVDYAPAQWSYTLLLAGAFTAKKVATADDSVFHVALTPTDTQPLNPSGGQALPYQYTERLTALDSSGEVVDVAGGMIMVEPNLAIVGDGEALSWEEKTLTVLQAKLAGRVTDDIENYSIAGRSISRIPLTELVRLEALFRARCYKRRNPGKFSQAVDVTFPSMSWGPYPYTRRWTG